MVKVLKSMVLGFKFMKCFDSIKEKHNHLFKVARLLVISLATFQF